MATVEIKVRNKEGNKGRSDSLNVLAFRVNQIR